MLPRGEPPSQRALAEAEGLQHRFPGKGGRKQLSGGSERCLARQFEFCGAPPQGSTAQAASQAGSSSGDNQQRRMRKPGDISANL